MGARHKATATLQQLDGGVPGRPFARLRRFAAEQPEVTWCGVTWEQTGQEKEENSSKRSRPRIESGVSRSKIARIKEGLLRSADHVTFIFPKRLICHDVEVE